MADEIIKAEGMALDRLVRLLDVPAGDTVILSRMDRIPWYQFVWVARNVVIEFYPRDVVIYTIARDDLITNMRYRNSVANKRKTLWEIKREFVAAWRKREEKSGISITVVVKDAEK